MSSLSGSSGSNPLAPIQNPNLCDAFKSHTFDVSGLSIQMGPRRIVTGACSCVWLDTGTPHHAQTPPVNTTHTATWLRPMSGDATWENAHHEEYSSSDFENVFVGPSPRRVLAKYLQTD